MMSLNFGDGRALANLTEIGANRRGKPGHSNDGNRGNVRARADIRSDRLVHRPRMPIGQMCAVAVVAAVLSCGPAVAQTNGFGSSSPGMGATSPLSLGSSSTVQPAGIPLGSTEIATPGTSPAAAPSGVGPTLGTTSCSDSSNAGVQSSGASFDGGGISGSASSSCATTATTNVTDASNPTASTSLVGRAEIPPGSTERGGAGLGSVAPVPAATVSPTVSSPLNGGTPCTATNASITMAAGGC
jgi:hypothetical protein